MKIQNSIVRMLVVFAVFGLGPVGGACAQPDSPASMRQRITELERTLVSVREDLGRMTAERDALAAEVETLRRALSGGGGAGPGGGAPGDQSGPGNGPGSGDAGDPPIGPAGLPISALSQEPLSSPDALFVTLLLEYRDAFGTDSSTPPSEADVRAWIAQMRTKFDGPSGWLVRIDRIERRVPDAADDAGMRVLATVLDPATGRPISRAVSIEIPRRFEGRFPAALGSGESLFADMRVKVGAAPVHQPGRVTAGPFDFPVYIGPYAGFGYDLEIVGLKFLTPEDVAAKRNRPTGPVDR